MDEVNIDQSDRIAEFPLEDEAPFDMIEYLPIEPIRGMIVTGTDPEPMPPQTETDRAEIDAHQAIEAVEALITF